MLHAWITQSYGQEDPRLRALQIASKDSSGFFQVAAASSSAAAVDWFDSPARAARGNNHRDAGGRSSGNCVPNGRRRVASTERLDDQSIDSRF
jgi:hypothetical protein